MLMITHAIVRRQLISHPFIAVTELCRASPARLHFTRGDTSCQSSSILALFRQDQICRGLVGYPG